MEKNAKKNKSNGKKWKEWKNYIRKGKQGILGKKRDSKNYHVIFLQKC